MSHLPFVMYGPIHITSVLIIFFLLPMLWHYFKRNKVYYQTISLLFIAILVFIELFDTPYSLYYLKLHWQVSLPLNMCDFSRLFIGLYLITERALFIELGLFWGIGGTLIAFLSPDLHSTFPSLEFWVFIFNHAIILFALTFILSTGRYHPKKRCLGRSIAIGILFTWILYVINLTIGKPANYWYLMSLPHNAIAFRAFMPPPPFHLIAFYLIGLIVFPLIYLPFSLIGTPKRSLVC